MIGYLRARLGADSDRDTGMTLVELLVTMVVVAILGGLMAVTISATSRTSLQTNSRQYETMQAQTVMDRASRYLRAAWLNPSLSPATAFTYAGPTEATFTSSLGGATGPTLVDLKVSGKTLTETLTPADAGSNYTWNGTGVTRVDSSDVTSNPVFTYYNANGTVLSTPMTTAAQTSAIVSVRVSLTETGTGVADPISDSTLIYLRNVEYH